MSSRLQCDDPETPNWVTRGSPVPEEIVQVSDPAGRVPQWARAGLLHGQEPVSRAGLYLLGLGVGGPLAPNKC